jgi:single-stranded DNA-binding protein
MAVKVEFQGYVNDVRHYDWGVVYNVAHRQVKKDQAGQWETVGYDYFSVSVNKAVDGVEKDSKVNVTGSLKTKRYEKRDGSGTAVALNVRADVVELVQRGASVSDMQAIWPEVKQIPEDNAPF